MDVRHCPRCAGRTESLKAYRLPTFLVFIGIGASFRHGDIAACPPCMRRELGRLTLINLLPANLLWVFLLVPWYGIAALRSLTRGHSDGAPSSPSPASAPGYRDAAPMGEIPMAGPWNGDPRVQPHLIPGRPGQLRAHLAYGGSVDPLDVQLLAPDGPGYRARTLTAVPRVQLAVGTELRLRHSRVHPPLVAVADAVVDHTASLECECTRCGFEHPATLPTSTKDRSALTECPACAGPMTVWHVPLALSVAAQRGWKIASGVLLGICVLFVGAAGYESESLGVDAALAASFVMGFVLAGWASVPRIRARRAPSALVAAAAIIGAFVGLLLAGFFFFGIFPAL